MMLEPSIIKSLEDYLPLMESPLVLRVSDDTGELRKFLEQIVALSPMLSIEAATLPRTPSFTVGERVTFAGIPTGHEFTSLIMALLQVSGRKPKIEDKLIERIKTLPGTHKFETYVSLTCHNCPEVVQALNILSVLNPNISHTMIEGGAFKAEVESLGILAVPYITLNGEFFDTGRITLEEILAKIDKPSDIADRGLFDVLVIGGGPAATSAAIYAARKGIKTGLVAHRFGGQVMDTLAIENFISTTTTQGPQLVKDLEQHVAEYEVDVINLAEAVSIEKSDIITVGLKSGTSLTSKSVILATGARWRTLGVPGEEQFKNKGVAYCPHCDGPLFKGKRVAVVGGGNSGVEAAIDLAGIVSHVTLIEYGAELKADAVLQKRLYSLSNVNVLKGAKTLEIMGTDRVNALRYSQEGVEAILPVAGVFVQIGLVPNTQWIDNIELNRFGEIIVDSHGATSMAGVYAAGDCTNIPFKQIVIAIGEGAKASLGAFEYLIRN